MHFVATKILSWFDISFLLLLILFPQMHSSLYLQTWTVSTLSFVSAFAATIKGICAFCFIHSRESWCYGNQTWSPLRDTYVTIGEVTLNTLRVNE